ncbi:hypothetical protein CBL21_27065, partial [Shigella flexneri]
QHAPRPAQPVQQPAYQPQPEQPFASSQFRHRSRQAPQPVHSAPRNMLRVQRSRCSSLPISRSLNSRSPAASFATGR